MRKFDASVNLPSIVAIFFKNISFVPTTVGAKGIFTPHYDLNKIDQNR